MTSLSLAALLPAGARPLRSNATNVALLPPLGVALGQGMGAGPLHVLLAATAGQLLLPAGAAAIRAEVASSANLTRAVVFW